jgi:phosphoglycerate-specific signal transduction histidine kinase
LGVPENAKEVSSWLTNGGALIALVVFFAHFVWTKFLKLTAKSESAVESQIKKIFKNQDDQSEHLERISSKLLLIESTINHKFEALENKNAELSESLKERRMIVDREIKELHASLNGLMVAKAKEIAEFDTKISELSRRLGKLEDQ